MSMTKSEQSESDCGQHNQYQLLDYGTHDYSEYPAPSTHLRQDASKLLVRTPSHYNTESFWGYILRISEANGYSRITHILAHAGLTDAKRRTSYSFNDKIAAIIGRSPAEISPIAYTVSLPDERREYQILGHRLGSEHHAALRLKTPSFCLQCTSQNGYLEALWDLKFVAACPIHRCSLIHQCSSCGRALRWNRPGLLTCACGAKLCDTPSRDVPQALVDLMGMIRSKLYRHHQVDTLTASGLPLSELEKIPLHTLLVKLALLGKFGLEAEGRESPYSDFDITLSAATVLSNWPEGFHGFLHRLDERDNESNQLAFGLRKRFESFYLSFFRRENGRLDFQFLRDEFVRFGLNEWGEGVVDQKLLGDISETGRFVSQAGLARLLNVQPSTVRQWTSTGLISARVIHAGNQKRYIVDTKGMTPIEKDAGKVCDVRAAAAFLGLPVSVLQFLRKSDHYPSSHMSRNKRGYHTKDLEKLAAKLLALSPLVENLPVSMDETYSLQYVMQEMRFWAKTGKGSFMSDFLTGKLKSVGRNGEAVAQIFFERKDVDNYASAVRSEFATRTISRPAAAKILNCSVEAITPLLSLGFLSEETGPGHARISRSTVEKFASTYVSIHSIAMLLSTTSSKLVRTAETAGIFVLSVLNHTGRLSGFIRQLDKDLLIRISSTN